jgi:hypothetical protein
VPYFFRRPIQIPLKNILAAMNFKKKIKDSYSGKFAEISERVQCGVSYFYIS